MKEEQFSRLPSNVSYDEWKYGKQNVEAKKLEKRLTEVEKKAANLAQTTYSGIWADDVTVADYSSKANSIQGKRDYYDEELKKYNALSQITNEAEFAEIRAKYDDEIKRGAFIFLDEEDKEALRKMVSNVDSSVWLGQHDLRRLIEEGKGYADNRVLYLTQRVQQLEDFEKKGKLYLQYQDEINKINEKLFKLGGGINPFGPDAYSQARLQNALRFDRRLQADKYLRPLLDKDWDKLTDHEKYSIWEYTRNSNPMNKSLSGYHDSWNRRDFLGLENTVWGHEDDWRSLSGFFRIFCKKGTYGDVDYHQAITALTNAIDKCKTNKDMWLVRGSDRSGFARLLEGNLFSFDEAVQILKSGSEEKMKKALVGQTFTNHSFMSTGIAEDAGFGGNVMYSIYAPKGTKGVYAEPQSYYGDTADDRLYKKGMKFHSVGGEAEMILQRGTQFRIRNITYDGWNIHVEMEIVGQPNYFKFGDEDTFNNGKTRHKK